MFFVLEWSLLLRQYGYILLIIWQQNLSQKSLEFKSMTLHCQWQWLTFPSNRRVAVSFWKSGSSVCGFGSLIGGWFAFHPASMLGFHIFFFQVPNPPTLSLRMFSQWNWLKTKTNLKSGECVRCTEGNRNENDWIVCVFFRTWVVQISQTTRIALSWTEQVLALSARNKLLTVWHTYRRAHVHRRTQCAARSNFYHQSRRP